MNRRPVNPIFFILAAILLCGCYNSKKAMRNVLKAQAHHPAVVASVCSSMYPPLTLSRDSIAYIEGAPQYRYDTVTVNCDSIMHSSAGSATTVRIPCPPCPQRTDTFFRTRYTQVENKAAITMLEDRQAKLSSAYDKLSVKTTFCLWWAIIASAALVAGVLLKMCKYL